MLESPLMLGDLLLLTVESVVEGRVYCCLGDFLCCWSEAYFTYTDTNNSTYFIPTDGNKIIHFNLADSNECTFLSQ